MKVLKNVGVGTELAKRFYLEDVTLTKPCDCGHIMSIDLSTQCLDYPVVGNPESLYMYCDNCDKEHEDAIKVTISINLTVEE